MKHIQPETKEAIVKQALEPNDKTIAEIAANNKIGYSTLQKWLRVVRDGKPLGRVKPDQSKQEISKSSQLNHLLATANLDETALGIYCRQHGIYSHQLTEWKESFMSDRDSQKTKNKLKRFGS